MTGRPFDEPDEPQRTRVRDADPRTLDRARRGELHAFEQLVREFQADVYRFAWHLTRDRDLADDVTQDAFLRAFRFIEGFRGDRKFGSWLFAITRNCAMDTLRLPRFPLLHEHDREVEGSVGDATAHAELDAALRSISAEHRETFLLVEVFGLSYQEASDVLGIATGTVKSRMFRARKALCAAIADGEPGEATEATGNGGRAR
ncbi:MAG TPA: RNA polymerase sigma factor [Actinomycetota bacterium]|nr:RNA polymerase sigma factor [Actinomycetota bacterium]